MPNKLKLDFEKLIFPLPVGILTIFICLFVIITGIIILLQSINFTKATTFTAKAMMENAATEVETELTKTLNPVEINAAISAMLIQNEVIKTDITGLIAYTKTLIQALPGANGSFYADLSGTQVYSARQNDNSIITDIQNRHLAIPIHEEFYYTNTGDLRNHISSTKMTGDDPRSKVWFLTVKNSNNVIWTQIFRFYDKNQLGIVVAAPIFNYQQFVGAFGFDVTLDHLSDFITNQKISQNGFSFVITADNNLVAYPKKKLFAGANIPPETLVNLEKVNLPLITESLSMYQKTKSMVTLTFNNNDYLILYRPITEIGHFNWYIGVVIPKSDLVGALQKSNTIIGIISVLLLLFGIIIVYRLVSQMMRPINLLALEAEKMKNFELGEELKSNSHIKEVIALTDSINNMKRGLKHFQKYVPKVLVRQLIESGKDLDRGGEKKPLVILFSDIENFTTIAETLDPYQLMLQLCEYFDALTDIIMEEMGTIDKYIGDAIMAFWGAPLKIEDPFKHAALAAIRCQQKVAELNIDWQNEGKPVFKTRIGLHAGEAIVGNVGSKERLNYTAIGDAINIASRLENINKNYHTQIIVSETIYEQIKNDFKLKLLDEVKVKGREKAIKIYELISIRNQSL